MNTNFYVILMLLLFTVGCKNESKKIPDVTNSETTEVESILGNYVSEDYSQRNEGYDWVAVQVREKENNQIHISIRSRADRKNPTCTFDAVAKKLNNNTYTSQIDVVSILFEFSNSQISISTEELNQESILNFYCSGGASIVGSYKKLDGVLDQNQIDKTTFSKALNLQGIGFNVSSIEEDGKNTLSIFTYGLTAREYNETFNIVGEEIVNAEVEDLNSDGSPELFVYTRSVGSGSYGNVYAFSVNNKKSMSTVYFQPTAENSKINQGYMGHDEFSLIENRLAQRFPIYKPSDTNANPTGGTRQISYRLVEGEGTRKLVVDNISEY